MPRTGSATKRGIGAVRVLVSARIGAYAELSKFGIVLLVLVSAGAGFYLLLLFVVMVGERLVRHVLLP